MKVIGKRFNIYFINQRTVVWSVYYAKCIPHSATKNRMEYSHTDINKKINCIYTLFIYHNMLLIYLCLFLPAALFVYSWLYENLPHTDNSLSAEVMKHSLTLYVLCLHRDVMSKLDSWLPSKSWTSQRWGCTSCWFRASVWDLGPDKKHQWRPQNLHCLYWTVMQQRWRWF